MISLSFTSDRKLSEHFLISLKFKQRKREVRRVIKTLFNLVNKQLLTIRNSILFRTLIKNQLYSDLHRI